MPIDRTFKSSIRKALEDKVLRHALRTFADRVYELRDKAYAGIDFESMRTEIATLKQQALENIEALAVEFQSHLEERGARVHRANDGSDVIEIIKDIAQRRNSSLCVKSKSMASEEIHLNEHMVDLMKVVETDLGEWLIQQVHETPSHMVLPAIHFTKERCAEVFSKYLDKHIDPDISTMVKHARAIMRNHFLHADIGISGCNIAVAETGTVCIFSNEGNVRLTATLPLVHIIIFGYEKFVAKFCDVATIARALPRSATGQLLTSYLTMISGPPETLIDRRSTGTQPKELHIIMLDNGRLNMLADPLFREAGQCIRCTSCLNVCPIYTRLGGHVYGKIYPGAIGSMLTYFFNSLEETEQIQELCISCGLCKEFCPTKIDIPGLAMELRKRVRNAIPSPILERVILENVLPSELIFSTSMKAAALASKPFSTKTKEGTGYIRNLPPGFKKLTHKRSLPAPCSRPFKKRFTKIEQKIPGVKKGTVAFFSGCAIEWLYPNIGASVVKVLNQCGYIVEYPEQKCCGAPAFFSGNEKAGLKLATDNIQKMNNGKWDYIVTACPTCTHVIKDLWKDMIHNNDVLRTEAEEIGDRMIDFVTLYHNIVSKGENALFRRPGETERQKVTYHYPCHLVRSMGIKEEPIKILTSLSGIEYVEMNKADSCCGFGGTYSIKFPDISNELLEQKIHNINETGAEFVITDCPGCLLNLAGGLDSRESTISAMHMAELLADYLERYQ
jgi:iron-sulfur cluster protein